MIKSIDIKAYIDKNNNPCCAESFYDNKVCIFYRTSRMGCNEICIFLDQLLERRGSGEGTLRPHDLALFGMK